MSESEWKDMSIAPKDGTLIQIRQGGWLPCHARWINGEWQTVEYQATVRPTHWRHSPPLEDAP